MEMQQVLNEFEKYLLRQGKTENTIKNYLADINNFTNYPHHRGDTPLSASKIDIEEYTRWLEKSGRAYTTINRRIMSLRTFFDFLIEKGVRSDNPAEEVKAKKVARQNETRWLERHQVRQIFEAIDKTNNQESKRVRDRAIISVLVNCGLRVQELCDLKMENLDFEHGIIEVVGKGGKYRKIPFNKATQKAVQRWLQYRDLDTPYVFHTERSLKMTPRAVQHVTKQLSEVLPFTFTVHQLRHTALKNVADVTGKIEIVAAIAGHESVETSRRYIEPSLQEISEAMQQNEYDF